MSLGRFVEELIHCRQGEESNGSLPLARFFVFPHSLSFIYMLFSMRILDHVGMQSVAKLN